MSAPITIVEAAKLFGCSTDGLREWIKRGMPATKEVKKGTGKSGAPKLLIDPEVARHWMIENKVRTFFKSEAKQAEPVPATAQKPAAVEAVGVILAKGDPVLMFCRSGTRSAVTWALAMRQAGADADGLRAAGARAGYDLSRMPL
jgi:3-mercaptopyruvate sulfurtransferase SseA